MSQGQPTKLVRDGGTESYDPPPDRPLPAPLVPCTQEGNASAGHSDLRRADEADPSYSGKRARRAVLDANTSGAFVDEPGGNW